MAALGETAGTAQPETRSHPRPGPQSRKPGPGRFGSGTMTPPMKTSGSIERPSTQLASPTDKAVPLAPDFHAGWVAESDAGPRQAEHTPVSGRKNVCLISSSRNATEHRILSKQAVSLVRAGYR